MPFAPTHHKKLPPKVKAAKDHFEKGGWSYRSAAPVLGVSYQHLCEVLNGVRTSRRLLSAVRQLPAREK